MTQASPLFQPDPNFFYEPHSAQLGFHDDRYRVLYRGLFGGTGSGKTRAGIGEAINWAITNPSSVGVIGEPTWAMLKKICLPTIAKVIGDPLESSIWVKSFNKSDLMLELNTVEHHDPRCANPRTSQVWLISMDEPEHAEGQNLDWAYLDEARLVRNLDESLKVLLRRLRGSEKGNNVGMWVTSTPDQPGSALHNFFENPLTKNPQAKVYRMSIFENPHLTDDFRKAIIEAHTGGLAERFVYGRFANVESGSFLFDSTVHVLPSQSVPTEFKEIRYGIDFGWTNPSAVIALGIDGDGRAYALDEVYARQMRTQDLIESCKEFVAKYGRGQFLCDRSEPQTIEELNRAGLQASGYEAKREDGIRQLGDRFKKAGDGRPRIYVSGKCANLINELQTYNEQVKENDHAVDALRYAIMGFSTSRARVSVVSHI